MSMCPGDGWAARFKREGHGGKTYWHEEPVAVWVYDDGHPRGFCSDGPNGLVSAESLRGFAGYGRCGEPKQLVGVTGWNLRDKSTGLTTPVGALALLPDGDIRAVILTGEGDGHLFSWANGDHELIVLEPVGGWPEDADAVVQVP